MFDIPEDYTGIDAIFRDANVTQLIHYDFDGQKTDSTDVDDEHLNTEFASPLLTQEREGRTALTQTYHSNEERKFVEKHTVDFSKNGESPVPC